MNDGGGVSEGGGLSFAEGGHAVEAVMRASSRLFIGEVFL